MGRGTSANETLGSRRNAAAGPVQSEWTRLARSIRSWAEEDGGGVPVTRKIRGQLWIAFDEVILDDIEDDDVWYGSVGLNEPFYALGSGAIRTVPGREDEALVLLAEQLIPFSGRLAALKNAA